MPENALKLRLVFMRQQAEKKNTFLASRFWKTPKMAKIHKFFGMLLLGL